jgi:hypothetical protein
MIERVAKGSGRLGSRTVQMNALAAVPPMKEERDKA